MFYRTNSFARYRTIVESNSDLAAIRSPLKAVAGLADLSSLGSIFQQNLSSTDNLLKGLSSFISKSMVSFPWSTKFRRWIENRDCAAIKMLAGLKRRVGSHSFGGIKR